MGNRRRGEARTLEVGKREGESREEEKKGNKGIVKRDEGRK